MILHNQLDTPPWRGYRILFRAITGKILEAGVVSGRILYTFNGEGIDSSPEMLASCRKHCQERGVATRFIKGYRIAKVLITLVWNRGI